MAILIMTVGLPRSGKTTWARSTGYPIVNPDSIRLSLHGKRFEPLTEDIVWAIAKIMVRSLFKAGHEKVVLDATNTTHKRRKYWEDPEWRREYQIIMTDAATCIKRALRENDSEILPIIEKMNDLYEPLDLLADCDE